MPATDALAPPLRTQTEKDIVRGYGGWTAFCHAFGLKPFNPDENDEAVQILRAFAREEDEKKGAKRRSV